MIFETFSQRKTLAAAGGKPDVYIYDEAPKHMRHQICMALVEGIGTYHVVSDHEFQSPPNSNNIWEQIDRICTKELLSYLSFRKSRSISDRLISYIMQVESIDDFLSAVELACLALSLIKEDPHRGPKIRGAQSTKADSLQEINTRFEQHAIGYRFENCQIIRIDSRFEHSEIVKPALVILSSPVFVKANDDFMVAHKHYRSGEPKAAVTAAHCAFESTMKAICDAENWTYTKGDRASDLVTRITTGGLFTHSFDKGLNSYVAMLKSGLPNVRNDAGAHGESTDTAPVTLSIARFAINMTASNIVFLGECYDIMKNRKS